MNRGLDDFIVDIEEGKGSRDVFIGRFLLRCSCEDDVMVDRLGGGYFCRRVSMFSRLFFFFFFSINHLLQQSLRARRLLDI